MEKSSVPALERGLNIIELIAKKKSISFNDLAKETGINATSLTRTLQILVAKGYTDKNSEGKYIIGLKMFSLLSGDSLWTPLIEKAQPLLEEISRIYSITVLLLGFSGDKITVLSKIAHPDNLTMQAIGEVKTDYILGPWGIQYISYMSSEERNKIIKRDRDHHGTGLIPPSDDTLERMMANSRKEGYCDDEASIMKNVRRFAVPVFNSSGNMIAALGTGSFVYMLKEDTINNLIMCIKEKAYVLTMEMQMLKH